MTARAFFQLYPELSGLLLEQLTRGAEAQQHAHPSLYPSLLLLSRLRPSFEEDAAPEAARALSGFEPAVRRCLSHSHHMARFLAARALVALVPSRRLPRAVADTLESLPVAAAPRQLRHNELHGLLLAARALLAQVLERRARRRGEEKDEEEEEQDDKEKTRGGEEGDEEEEEDDDDDDEGGGDDERGGQDEATPGLEALRGEVLAAVLPLLRARRWLGSAQMAAAPVREIFLETFALTAAYSPPDARDCTALAAEAAGAASAAGAPTVSVGAAALRRCGAKLCVELGLRGGQTAEAVEEATRLLRDRDEALQAHVLETLVRVLPATRPPQHLLHTVAAACRDMVVAAAQALPLHRPAAPWALRLLMLPALGASLPSDSSDPLWAALRALAHGSRDLRERALAVEAVGRVVATAPQGSALCAAAREDIVALVAAHALRSDGHFVLHLAALHALRASRLLQTLPPNAQLLSLWRSLMALLQTAHMRVKQLASQVANEAMRPGEAAQCELRTLSAAHAHITAQFVRAGPAVAALVVDAHATTLRELGERARAEAATLRRDEQRRLFERERADPLADHALLCELAARELRSLGPHTRETFDWGGLAKQQLVALRGAVELMDSVAGGQQLLVGGGTFRSDLFDAVFAAALAVDAALPFASAQVVSDSEAAACARALAGVSLQREHPLVASVLARVAAALESRRADAAPALGTSLLG
jgi:hypothetical protein